jgi:hypothetical protein
MVVLGIINLQIWGAKQTFHKTYNQSNNYKNEVMSIE